MKYVMFEVRQGGVARKVPVVFPNELVHRYVAAAFKAALMRHWERAEIEVVSAGSVEGMIGAGIATVGFSETLGVEADPADAKVIGMYDYLHGV